MGKKKSQLVTAKGKKAVRRAVSPKRKGRTPKFPELPTRKSLTEKQQKDLSTRFQSGNNFWARRTKYGRDKIFTSPEIMAEVAAEYWQLCVDMPYEIHDIKVVDKTLQDVYKEIMRPFTVGGLCIYMGVNMKYFSEFTGGLKTTDKNYTGFSAVLGDIDNTCRTQKLQGAMINAYNASIVAYDLGLKRDMPVIGSIGLSITVVSDGSRALLEEVKAKLEELDKEE